MSTLGQNQTLALQKEMSTLPPKTDIRQCKTNVRFGSKADICSAKRHVRFTPKATLNAFIRSPPRAAPIYRMIFGSVLDAAAKDPEVMKTLRETAFAADKELIAPMMWWRYNGQPAGNGWTSAAKHRAVEPAD